MEHACYRCGSPVEAQTPFCPSCGAPQIRVPSREPQVEESTTPVPPPPLPEGAPEQHFVHSIRIHWKGFLRIGLPLALASGLAGIFPPIGLPVFLLSVVASVQFYRKRHLGPLRAFQGAQLGALLGLLSSLTWVVLRVLHCVLDKAACRDELIRSAQLASEFNPSPQSQEFLQFLLQSGTHVFGFFALSLVFSVFCMLILGGVTGALTAGLWRDRPSA